MSADKDHHKTAPPKTAPKNSARMKSALLVYRGLGPKPVSAAVVMILIIGFGSSLWLFKQKRAEVYNTRLEKFQVEAESLAAECQDHVQILDLTLAEIQTAFIINYNIDLARWRAIAASVSASRQRRVSIAVSGFITNVGIGGDVEFLAGARMSGQPNFKITPQESDSERAIVQYNYPDPSPFVAPGQDFGVDPEWWDALRTARDTGATTSLWHRLPDTNEPFITMIQPVFRERAGGADAPASRVCAGWVFLTWNSREFLADIVDRSRKPFIAYLAHDTYPRPSWDGIETGALSTSRHLTIGDQRWILWISDADSIVETAASLAPYLMLLIGSAATASLAIVIIYLFKRHEALQRRFIEQADATRNASLQKRAMSLMATATDNGVLITDPSGIVLWANEGFERITGISRAEIISKHSSIFTIGADAGPDGADEFKRKLETGKYIHSELTGKRKDGETYWVECEVHPICNKSGEITNCLVIQRDITDRKRVHEELERAREIAVCNAELRTQFLDNLTRELRTHLTGVIGMSKMLLDTELAAEQREFVQTVRRSGGALEKILDEIHDLSRIEAGSLVLERLQFDPRELLEDMVEIYAEEAGMRGLELVSSVRPRVPRQVVGDPARVRQVLANLIDNAIKFTDVGDITVRIDLCEEPTNPIQRLRFTVSDTGTGISAEDCRNLFQPFVRGSNAASRGIRGPALGLAVSRRIAARMDGNLTVESTIGKGSTFAFEFPCDVSNEEPEVPRAEFSGKRIYVADDHPESRANIVELLRSWGAEVTEAPSSLVAIGMLTERMARKETWDAILIDQEMPVVDGATFVKAIREEIGNITIPIIFMSMFADRIPAEERARFGRHILLSKPVRSSRLHESVRRALSGENMELKSANAPESASARQAANVVAEHNGRRHALIVEDDAVCQKVAMALLKKLGWTVETARNGIEGVKMAAENRFDMILMDCQMPEMDGFEATAAIRQAEPPNRHVPILAMTANTGEGDRKRCIASGMDDFLSKPMKLEELNQRLRLLASGGDVKSPESAPISAPKPTPGIPQDVFDRIATKILQRLKAVGLLEHPTECEGTVRSFIKGAGDIVVSARKAFASKDVSTGVGLTQRLQRASAHFGADGLSERAGALLETIETGELDAALEIASQVEAELDLVREVALELVKNPESLRKHGAAAGIL